MLSNIVGQINVMIVDDSAVIRGLLSGILKEEKNINIVYTASNGDMAVSYLKKHPENIDVVTLDIQMPEKDGLSALPELLEASPDIKVIMVSTLSHEGAKETVQALAKGAADYIAKPANHRQENAINIFAGELIEKINALGKAQLKNRNVTQAVTANNKDSGGTPQITLRPLPLVMNKPEALVIGSSTGGPQALLEVFKHFSGREIQVPIFITQHMPAEFTGLLAKQINASSGVVTKEGENGEKVQAGVAYIAPGDFHMLVEEKEGAKYIKLDKGQAENYCRPAVDPMLRSIVSAYGGKKTLMMMLTGMGSDGLASAKILVDEGGVVIAQDKQTSVVWGMPGAVAMAGLCAHVLPLHNIADKFIELSKGQIR